MSNAFTPLQVAEKLLNGIENVGLAAGRHEKAAYPWRYPNASRMAGDFPSAQVIRKVYDRLASDGYSIRIEHLIFGASAEDVDELLASRPPPNETQAA